jgi:hypothetical protein
MVEERMATLRQLEAEFLRIVDACTMQHVPALAEAQGVRFLCPRCFTKNGGAVGTHVVICWFRGRGVPDDCAPKPGRWAPEGTGLDDLTFVPGDPPHPCSVLLSGPGCGWHGFVRNGEAVD